MTELYLIPDQGWKLVTERRVQPCRICRTKVEFPFYYCKETEMTFHKECEEEITSRACHSLQDEHIHYNIILMDGNNFLNLLFAFIGHTGFI